MHDVHLFKNAEGILEQMQEAGRIPGAFLHREDL